MSFIMRHLQLTSVKVKKKMKNPVYTGQVGSHELHTNMK